jgi:hypothetical protein
MCSFVQADPIYIQKMRKGEFINEPSRQDKINGEVNSVSWSFFINHDAVE